jgi:hypothetical protein
MQAAAIKPLPGVTTLIVVWLAFEHDACEAHLEDLWPDELERRNALGIVGPDPIPNSNDVIINVNAGEVHIRGPVTNRRIIEMGSRQFIANIVVVYKVGRLWLNLA